MQKLRWKLAECGDIPDSSCCIRCEYDDSVRLLATIAKKLNEIDEDLRSAALEHAMNLVDDAIDRLLSTENDDPAALSDAIFQALEHVHLAALVASVQVRAELMVVLPTLRNSAAWLAAQG